MRIPKPRGNMQILMVPTSGKFGPVGLRPRVQLMNTKLEKLSPHEEATRYSKPEGPEAAS